MIRSVLLLILAICFSFGISAQDNPEDITIIYNSQFSGAINIHSDGWGGNLTLGKYRGAQKVMLFGLDFVSMKHEKEVKSYNPVYEDSKSYVYGKTHSFFVVRPSFGRKKIITNKIRRSGVQVAYSWQFGPSLGLTKPVYLEIGYPSIPYDYLAVERYDPDRHYFDDIYGRASGLRGFSEIKLYPGGFAKFAFNFEYANQKDRIKGIEAGAVLDVYAEQIPIMAEEIIEKNRQYFLTFYINLFFGKKYIKR